MEFFLYLNQNTLELVEVIKKANYSITEYDSVCSNALVNGATRYPKKILAICTDNIKTRPTNLKEFVNRVITHEAMHIVHMCNGLNPLGLSKSNLSQQNRQNIERSVSMGINTNYNIEYEAYMMEDNPKQVTEYIKKFCF